MGDLARSQATKEADAYREVFSILRFPHVVSQTGHPKRLGNVIRKSIEVGGNPNLSRHRARCPRFGWPLIWDYPRNRLTCFGQDHFVALLHLFDEGGQLSFGLRYV